MTPPWQPPPVLVCAFSVHPVCIVQERVKAFHFFTDIFLFFLPREVRITISPFISLSSAMPRTRILHLAAGIVGWAGEFREEQIGDLAHGFAPIKP